MTKAKVTQAMEVEADSQSQEEAEEGGTFRQTPLINEEDVVTQHKEGCAAFASNGHLDCNCKARK